MSHGRPAPRQTSSFDRDSGGANATPATLIAITTQALNSIDVEELVPALASLARALLGVRGLTLTLLHPEAGTFVADANERQSTPAARRIALADNHPLRELQLTEHFPSSQAVISQSIIAVPLNVASTTAGGIAVDILGRPATDFDVSFTLLPVVSVAERALALMAERNVSASERARLSRSVEWQRVLIAGLWRVARANRLGPMLDSIARVLERTLPHQRLELYVADEEPGTFISMDVREGGVVQDPQLTLASGEGVIGVAVLNGAPVLSTTSPGHPDGQRADMSVLAAPLIYDTGTIGALSLARSADDPFSAADVATIGQLVPSLAETLETARLIVRNLSLYQAAVRALSTAIDAKDPYAREHSQRVARYATRLARILRLSDDVVTDIELAALLHDIGKIAVPDEILSKPGLLSPAERVVMMAHPSIGADMVSTTDADELQRITPLVRHHHEWHHGGGYPSGLSGDDIPLGAAIIAVADAFDTMTTDRAYRPAMTVSAALTEALRSAGLQFRPDVVAALESIVDTTGQLPVLSLETPLTSASDASLDIVSRITPVDARPVSVLYRIAGAIASIRELSVFLDRVANIIADELNYPNVSILLPEPDATHLRVVADVWPDGETLVGALVPIDRSISGTAYRTASTLNVPDIDNHPAFLPTGALESAAELAVPLLVDGRVVGVINVESSQLAAFSTLDERILIAIAAQVAPALELAKIHDELKHAAQRDGLTGIYNHAAFYVRLQAMLAAERQFALFIFDVEGLKRMNDTAGHLAGDSALRRVAAALDLATRPEDMVARYGGDEFAVIVDGVGEEMAVDMALRLQATVNQLTWGAQGEHISISVGVAVAGLDGRTATELVERADRRMYDTRTEARNRRGITSELRERRAPRRRAGHIVDDDEA